MDTVKKGYYIYYETDIDLIGVNKKVDSQIDVFNQYFECKKIVVSKEKKNIIKSIIWRLPFGSYGREYEETFEEIKDKPDYIYIRFVPVDRRFFNFIKKIRQKFPKIKILLEMATFPYKRELLHNVTMFPFYFKDRVYQKKLKSIVDCVVTYSDDDEIFGIPTIHIINGIAVNNIEPLDDSNDRAEDCVIRLLAVAILQKSHGYERCIEGLARYYQNKPAKKIEIHIVGDGSELNYYKKLVSQYQLEKYVFFYGRKAGGELDEIYQKADLALGAFGFYKRGINKSSALKVREYLAKGLPVVSGCMEDAMQKGGEKFFCLFPNDTSYVDMTKIVDFYKSIYETGKSRDEVYSEVREYARKTVDIYKVMKPVIDYLQGGNKV